MKDTIVALKLCYLRLEIAKMLNKFIVSEIINYFIQIASADDGARRDSKSLCKSSCQLFKAGHLKNLKAKAGCHCITIILSMNSTITDFSRPYSFFSYNFPSK